MPSYLTRRVSFAAAHRYRIAEWSDERIRAKRNNQFAASNQFTSRNLRGYYAPYAGDGRPASF